MCVAFGSKIMNYFESVNLKTFKKVLLSVSCLLIVTLFSAATVSAQNATFDRMWIDYDITENSQKGMLLHTKFTANGLKAADCQIRIKFFYDNETPLKDNNQRFYTTEGNVAVFRDIKPGYDPAAYNDFQIFMPYDELDLPYGEYKLKMDVDLIYKSGDLIQHLTWYDFQYSKKPPATTPTNTTNTTGTTPTATFDSMWVEYDVTEEGQRGMRIHAKFTVSNMKDVKSYLAFYFENENGTRLKSYDKKFESTANDVAVYRSMTPGFDRTVYNDLSAFIPYNEIHLPSGKYNLKIDADLIYEAGGLIQHLAFKDFQFTRP